MRVVKNADISVHGLSCRRGGRWLFRDLEWHASGGDLVSVSGPNGAGKTSLLRLVAGLGLPDAGDVRWQGRPVGDDRSAFNAEIGWVGHADGVKGDLTPRENLAFHRAMQRTPTRTVDAALDAFGLAPVADTPCRLLSAGQRRRTALARLLVAGGRLWILDEPLTALDVEGQRRVESLVAAHLGAGGIALVTSHQPFAALRPGIEVALA